MTAGTGDVSTDPTGQGERTMCQMNVEPFKQCCCKCIYHLSVNYHCTTSPQMRHDVGGCCCSVQKGWACVAPGFNCVHDNWPEHSCGCELYTPKDKSQPQVAPTGKDEYGTKLDCEICYVVRERDRILAAIKDDALTLKLLIKICTETNLLPTQVKHVFETYRAALMERINAKENPNG